MLGKLIKHEWKAVWKFLTIVNVFMLCITIVGVFGVTLLSRISIDDNPWMGLLIMLYVMLYIFGMVGVTYSTLIYLGIRFYKSMYSSEGYLTHTLPATSLQLISAKAIVAVIWSWICTIIMFAGIFLLGFCANAAAGSPIIFADLREGFQMLNEGIASTGLPVFVLVIEYGLIMILSSIASITVMYAAIALGQLFNKHRILSAVGIYFGFLMVSQIVGSVFGFMFGITSAITTVDGHSTTMSVTERGQMTVLLSSGLLLLWTVILLVGSFLITYFVTKKKLNLE